MDEIDWQNGFEASLNDRVVPTDTYIKMTPVPEPAKGHLVLEDNSKENFEVIYYTSKDTAGVYTSGGGERNLDGNSTGVHAAGSRVRMNITAQALREIRDHAKNIADTYSALPTGTVLPFAGPTAPTLFLLCQGQAVSRVTYADLFGIIGTTYGAGDGSTTFTLPDLRGRSVFGYDSTQSEFNALGKKGGQKDVQAHTHTTTFGTADDLNKPWNANELVKTDNNYGNVSITSSSTGSGVNNLNPYNTMNFIIRT